MWKPLPIILEVKFFKSKSLWSLLTPPKCWELRHTDTLLTDAEARRTEIEIWHFSNSENNHWKNAWRWYALVVSNHFRPFGGIGSALYSWLKCRLHFRQTPPESQLNFERQINRKRTKVQRDFPEIGSRGCSPAPSPKHCGAATRAAEGCYAAEAGICISALGQMAILSF